MSDFRAVRCSGAEKATPYLRKWLPEMLWAGMKVSTRVVDLACGNLRNTKFLRHNGFWRIQSLDAKPDRPGAIYWSANQMIPTPNSSVGLVLCQYLLMFLNDNEVEHVVAEIKRIAKPKCVVVIELEDVKQGVQRRMRAFEVVQLFNSCKCSPWRVINLTKQRVILQLSE